MLEVLVTSGAVHTPLRAWGSRVTSLMLHAALIAVAVGATRHSVPDDVETHRDTTIFWVPEPVFRPVSHASVPPGPQAPVLRVPVIVPPVIPDLDPAPGVTTLTDWPASSDTSSGWRPGVPGMPGAALPPGAPIDARLAEEPPVLLSHPAPRYPGLLRQAGIEGRVVVEVVLDTLGRAEPASLHVATSAHPLFDTEASRVVLGSRYRPARMGGRPVRVRVSVPVTFGLRR